MKIRFAHALLLTLLAVIFTIGLTFASVELPRLADSFLQRTVSHPGGDSHASDLGVFKAELFIKHYHIRLIGYACFILVLLLIAVGFITNRSGLATLGAIGFILPVFAQFAGVMFFLAGLGILNLFSMPILDISPDILRLGDIVYVPYRFLIYIHSLFHSDIHYRLIYIFIGSGLLLFTLGTITWFYARIQKKNVADFWVYRICRHPQYLGWIIWSYGMLISLNRMKYPKRSWGIASSLPWLLSTMVIIGVAMLEELKMKRERGQEYELYRKRTPFMFPMPRVVSKILGAPMRLILRKEYPERKREVALVIAISTAILIVLSLFFGGHSGPLGFGKHTFIRSEKKNVHELVKRAKVADRRSMYYVFEDLVKAGEPAVDPLIELLNYENRSVQQYSAEALGKLKSRKAVKPLIEVLRKNDGRDLHWPIAALGEIRSQEAIPALLDYLEDENGVIQYNVADALGKLGSEQGIDALIAGLKDDKWYFRIANANSLGETKAEKAVEPLAAALKDENEKVRRAAALALLRIESEKAVAPLTEALSDEDWGVRFYADEALKAIHQGGK